MASGAESWLVPEPTHCNPLEGHQGCLSGHPLFHLIPIKSFGGNVCRSNRALGTSPCSGKNSLYEEINMYLQLLLNRELKKSVLHMVMFSVKPGCAYGSGFVCLLEEHFSEADENRSVQEVQVKILSSAFPVSRTASASFLFSSVELPGSSV